jgi:hypothetical protein
MVDFDDGADVFQSVCILFDFIFQLFYLFILVKIKYCTGIYSFSSESKTTKKRLYGS